MDNQFIRIKPENIKTNLINLSQLVFEVIDMCNLNCRYCGYGDLYKVNTPRNNGNLSLKKAQNILARPM